MEGEEEEEGNTKSHGCLGALCKIDGGDDRPHTQSTKDSNLRPLSMPLPLSLCETFIGNNAPRQKSELSFYFLKSKFVFDLFLPFHASNAYMPSGK